MCERRGHSGERGTQEEERPLPGHGFSTLSLVGCASHGISGGRYFIPLYGQSNGRRSARLTQSGHAL